MEAPGRCWGCLTVEVLLIPSASHWHSSHAGPDVQPSPGSGPFEPPALGLSRRRSLGATGPCGHQHWAAAPHPGCWGVRRGGGRHPRHSQGVLSQNHTLEFVGARGSVPSPFGLFLLLLAFLWDLLPYYPHEIMEGLVHVQRWVLGTGFYIRNVMFCCHFSPLFSCNFP